MSDDIGPGARANDTDINTGDPWDMFLWCRTLGITKSQMETAIQSVGTSLEHIRRYVEDERLHN